MSEEVSAAIVSFLVYDEDGAIVVTGTCPPQFVAMQAGAPGRTAIIGEADAATQYVDPISGQILPKQPMSVSVSAEAIAADGVQECVVSGVPAGTHVSLRNDEFECDDGSVEFSTTTPGEHVLELRHPRYLMHSVTVTAT